MRERGFGEELERRLEVIEGEGHEDPARRDIPATDLIVLGVVIVVSVVLLYWWGY